MGTYEEILEHAREKNPRWGEYWDAVERHACLTCQNSEWIEEYYISDSCQRELDRCNAGIGLCLLLGNYGITTDDNDKSVGCEEYEPR